MDAGAAWHPVAAYLYVLHLDGASLAWEYLRRNPEYRRDWHLHRRRPERAQHWGLRLLEDPDLDARDALPDWFPEPPGTVHLLPDADPPPGATPFRLWDFPGEKRLLHDGRRLLLTVRMAGRTRSFVLSPELEDGKAYVYAVRAGPQMLTRWRNAEMTLAALDALHANDTGVGVARDRPGRTALLHLRTLQALDGVQSGASQRKVAEVLYGAEVVAERWYSDGQLRAHVRRLIARGRRLMQGGYRRLLHPRR
ncbi:DUF2285 domain-containing protein [Pseudoxanthomonas suwonensis]|uniref:DUF2285 domain-containing protein n=1 Tax=Pseudoxanthomonas suwonensis TaxID=314722 RepID=A0A0E3Z110_9GAMM|nr:DUF2285 domain-containing protein [Pseudoxanthomonas suwonensis]AKC86327.1 hypothetical protein WQ53_05595 [Pseudoxanthomonas suwonensis]